LIYWILQKHKYERFLNEEESSISISNPVQYKDLLLYPRHEKQRFAGENRILIDDLEKTIDEWNAKGGIGIHHTSAISTIRQLKNLGL
jgi:hypothetical protein